MNALKKIVYILAGFALTSFLLGAFALPLAAASPDSLAASSQVSLPYPHTETDSDFIEATSNPDPEYGDIIEFPDKRQIAYVGGQIDAKSAAPFIRDHSGIFNSSKVANWEKQAAKLAKKYGIAPYIVTVNSFQGHSPEQWAANYYNANKLGLNPTAAHGVIMVINPDSRDVWFLGHGNGKKAFTPYGIDKLYDRIKAPLGDDDWDGGAELYLQLASEYLEQWNAGTPYDEGHKVPLRMTFTSTVIGAGGALLFGSMVGVWVMGVLEAKHNTAKEQKGATNYILDSSRITAANDVLVSTYTTKEAIPKSSSSSSGSFSSGGTSFSSGGGKF